MLYRNIWYENWTIWAITVALGLKCLAFYTVRLIYSLILSQWNADLNRFSVIEFRCTWLLLTKQKHPYSVFTILFSSKVSNLMKFYLHFSLVSRRFDPSNGVVRKNRVNNAVLVELQINRNIRHYFNELSTTSIIT